jgi:hypothetical protein
VLQASPFHQALANTSPKLAQGVSLQGQYRVWQGPIFSGSLGLGVIACDMAYTSELNGSAISNDESSINTFYTAARAYPRTDNMHMSVSGTGYNLSINNVNNIALSLNDHF